MKIKMTRKDIEQGYDKVYCLGYCEAQYLLRGAREIGYNCGLYGWNYDVYEIEHNGEMVAVCTGYRGMAGTRPAVAPKKWEDKARKEQLAWGWQWKDMKRRLKTLINQWLNAIDKKEV